eukprot:TRINITY_DN4348_c0_g1_i1.p2 TRINITY_DN4348_c0_g1~~TRINITY_DN4348_c0_g1_i1.p2  ORF type:complete len:241 (+),score=78.17 TRINITY_DN4348_c0_g1_i1:124-846(+)
MHLSRQTTPSPTPQPSRLLTPSELQSTIERLTRRPKHELQEQHAPTRTISPEELDKFFERHYQRSVTKIRKKRETDDEDITWCLAKADPLYNAKHRKGDLSEKEQTWVDKMYTQPLRRKEVKIEQLERKFHTPLPSVKQLTPEAEVETIERLFKSSVDRKKVLLERAEEKVYGKPPQRKALSPDEVSASVRHLFTESLKQREEKLAKIEEETAFKRKPPKRLSPSDIEATFARLRTPAAG